MYSSWRRKLCFESGRFLSRFFIFRDRFLYPRLAVAERVALRLNRTAKRKKSGVKPPHSKSNPIDCSKLVSNKQHILRRITEVAKKLGRAPSLLEFVALSEISRYSISSCFPKWNDAVREAGLHPRRLRVRPEDDELLKDWAKTVRKTQTLPSQRAYLLAGRHEPRTLEKRFDGWESRPQALRKI